MENIAFAERTAVITGAAGGIGRALAAALAARGADLVLADVDEAALANVKASLEGEHCRVLCHRVDVRSVEDNQALANRAFAWAKKPIGAVFANAGIHCVTSGIEPDLPVWERMIDINLMGPVRMAAAFLPRLAAQGLPAQFVMTASGAAFLGAPGISSYVATKHAIWGYAECLRSELLADGSPVQVSIIAPGRTRSTLTETQRERIRGDRGDAAAEDYDKALAPAEVVAGIVVREVSRRSFVIVPSSDDIGPLLAERIAGVSAAIQRDRIML
jgi:NAD(P)-dependent dehydrogenase (short-subunit alcohol dehydrogenase family)